MGDSLTPIVHCNPDFGVKQIGNGYVILQGPAGQRSVAEEAYGKVMCGSCMKVMTYADDFSRRRCKICRISCHFDCLQNYVCDMCDTG